MAPRSILIFAYCYSALCIVINLTLGILPAVLVWGLQMLVAAKRALAGILGLGAIASVAVIIRMPYLKYYTDSEFLSASLVTLKPLFRWFSDSNSSSYRRKPGSGYALSSMGGGKKSRSDRTNNEPRSWRPDLMDDIPSSNVHNTSVSTVDGAMHSNSSQENLTGYQKRKGKDESKVTISVHHSFRVDNE
ncbi:hypothetical protein BDV19DRAFT_387550 [Aspergillus venezuelensis]